MRSRNPLSILFIFLLTLVLCLPAKAMAADQIDTEQEVSLTVTFRSNDTVLTDLPFDLYLVATMDAYGELTVTEDFRTFNIDIRGRDDAGWRTLASTLEGYVLQYATPIDSGVTNQHGQVAFPNTVDTLPHGLYFVPGFRYVQGGFIYEAEPFMVLLPCVDEVRNQWNYDLSVQPKYSQPEDQPVVRRVLKVWNDNGDAASRPKEIVVQLLRDGEVYETVTLNESNNWRWAWVDLSGQYRWWVTEQVPDGYTVEISQEGITFVVTNTPEIPDTPDEPEKPDEPHLPQTGQLWWPVPTLAMAGLFLIAAGLLRRRGERHA